MILIESHSKLNFEVKAKVKRADGTVEDLGVIATGSKKNEETQNVLTKLTKKIKNRKE